MNEELITALKHIASTMKRNGDRYYQHVAEDAIKALEREPKTGHWISRWYKDKHFHVCSECQEEFSHDAETGIEITNYHICPNCGAKMESEG